jgi:prepilin-type N-terminal cleavage/methylation domain-containing protein/prepilin-type processing-associated H-X9-DG protein
MQPSYPSLQSVNKRGFSLIELLVCIGIIALLVGILMPVLSKAKQAANQVYCANNLRSIAQATVLYYNEQNDLPSTAQSYIDLRVNQKDTAVMLAPHMADPERSANPSTSERITPWTCLNDHVRWNVTGGTYYYYLANLYTIYTLNGQHFKLRVLLDKKPRTPLFMDWASFHLNSKYGNVCYFDGSVTLSPPYETLIFSPY